jgi:uncharacterized damage-inducible protein DinB
MPTECDRIADQLFRMVEGDAWHGPSVRALIADVTATTAASHPITGAHSIWELVHHMTAWAVIARRRLGGEIVDPTPAEDWPPVDTTTAAAWATATQALERSHADLRRAVLALGDGHLEDRTPGKPHSLYVLLHGVVQHTAYHAGQVAVLRRAAG